MCFSDILLEPYRAFRVLSSLDCGATAVIELELLNTPLLSFSWNEMQIEKQTQTEETRKKEKQPLSKLDVEE